MLAFLCLNYSWKTEMVSDAIDDVLVNDEAEDESEEMTNQKNKDDDDYHATLKALNSKGQFPRKSLGQVLVQRKLTRLKGLVNGGAENHETNAESPGPFKWEGFPGLSSPLNSDKRKSQVDCLYYGKLRSPIGSDIVLKESDVLEAAVGRLFATSRTNAMHLRQNGAAHCLQKLPSEGQMWATAAEVQNFLVCGKKREALHGAQVGHLWGPALVLAAQLGDQFYVDTVKQMSLRQLVPGSPLWTLCLLIAGQHAEVFKFDASANSGMFGDDYMNQQAMQLPAQIKLKY